MSTSKKVLTLLCSLCMAVALLLGLMPLFNVKAEAENIMGNGPIESAGAINSQYGDVGVWYHNGGQIDAEFVTTPVHSEGSTGSMLHHGAKAVYYRFFQGYDKVVDTSYSLTGYVYTTADGVKLDISLVNMMGSTPYTEHVYKADSIDLVKDAWTEINLDFRFDSAASKLIIGEPDNEINGETDDVDVELSQAFDILNISFNQTQEVKADVVYDDFSMIEGSAPANYKNIMDNGAVESAGCIDYQYGNTGLWYHNGGQLDATFITTPVHSEGSTGALGHGGNKALFYRFFQGYDNLVDKDYILKGYIFTQTEGVKISVKLINMMGTAPYTENYYDVISVDLTPNAWTEVFFAFRFDSATNKLIIGDADTGENGEVNDVDITLSETFDILNVAFIQTQDTKAQVAYDDFSCWLRTEGEVAPPVDYSEKDYDNRYDGVENFANLPGNIITDGDMTLGIAAPPAIKWGSYASELIEMDTTKFLTGNSSYAFKGRSGQDIRFGMPISVVNGQEHKISLYATQEQTEDPVTLSLKLVASAYTSSGGFGYAWMPLDEVQLSSDTWREITGTIKMRYDAENSKFYATINGGEEIEFVDMNDLISVELLVIVNKNTKIYIDSAVCFAEHTSKIKYIGDDNNPIADLELDVKDAFGNASEVAYTYNADTGYYEFEKSNLPLSVTATVDGSEIVKHLFCGNDNITVLKGYIPEVTVKDQDGKALSGATVKLVATDGKEFVLIEKEGSTGVYVTDTKVNESEYKVVVYKQGYIFTDTTLSFDNRNITVTGNEDKPVTYRAEVSIFDKDFKAVTGAKVELLENGEVVYTLAEVGDGVYALDNIVGFSFVIKVTKDGYEFDEDVKLDANNRSITISATKVSKGGCGGSLSGTILISALSLLAVSAVIVLRRKYRNEK